MEKKNVGLGKCRFVQWFGIGMLVEHLSNEIERYYADHTKIMLYVYVYRMWIIATDCTQKETVP